MPRFNVIVRRIVREDITIEIDAADAETARTQAELIATDEPQEKWETYDCDYSSDPAHAMIETKERG